MSRTRLRALAALVLVAIAAGAIAARADSDGRRPVRHVAVARPLLAAPPAAGVLPTAVRLFPKAVPCLPARKKPAASPAAPPSQALLGAFAVLRRERKAEDALPAAALEALRRVGLEPVSPDSARLIRTTPAGGRAWVVPVPDVGRAGLFPCRGANATPREGLAVVAVGDAAAGGGGALADLVRGRAPVVTDPCAGPDHDMLGVSGIVPDGVAAAFLTAPDGTAVRADVKDNAYEFLVPSARSPQQRYVVWTGGDGTPHVQPVLAEPLPVPRARARALIRPRKALFVPACAPVGPVLASPAPVPALPIPRRHG